MRGKIILLKPELRPIVDALIDGARNTLPVAMACAAAGIIIGIVILTGLGIVFTQWVVGLAQDMRLLALLLTMSAGIILGMGMPTTPAYIIMVALLVPALVKLGVVVPAAHMFAFYFAVLSAITPPVALAVYRGVRPREVEPVEDGLGCREDRRGRVHRALHVRVRAGAADDRRVAQHRLAVHPVVRRNRACWRLACTATCSA